MANTKEQLKGQIDEIKARWFVFLDKMENRMQELCEASIPELEAIYKNDEDELKRSYGRFLSGLEGQLNEMLEKGRKIEEDNVNTPLDNIEDQIDDLDDDDFSDYHNDISELCNERFDQFESKIDYWVDKLRETEKTGSGGTEAKYQAILDEYDAIKDKFSCKQCGSPITISKIFFTAAYVDCPACQTQNTFEPSSQVRAIDYIGRELAEERTAHLLMPYEKEKEREDGIYEKINELESELIDYEIDDNDKKIAEVKAKLAEQKNVLRECKANIPELYKKYLKAKFDEWISLVPGLEEQNKRVYEGWLKEYERSPH